MKKTLAAVLAAAMALSTATVAMAKDQLDGDTILENISVVDGRQPIQYGKEYSFVLSTDVLGATDITATQLGKWVKNGDATVTVTVTEGMNQMDSRPTATVKNIVTTEEVEDSYKWDFSDYKNAGGATTPGRGKKFTIKVDGKTIVEHGTTINGIPVDKNGNFTLTQDDVEKVIYPKDSGWEGLRDAIVQNHLRKDASAGEKCVAIDKTKLSVENTAPVVQVKFKVKDTWGTGTTNIGMKFKITFKKTVKDSDDDVLYSKGDTVMADEALFKASYFNMNDKGTDMELTLEECKNREVLMNKDGELYDKIGTDEFTLYFQDAAAFTGKMSPTQKALNMYYSVDDISDISDLYPDIDFEFIEFKGKPSFVNNGSMTFNAIGGKDTVVYTYDGDSLTPFTSNASYSSTYNTVTVKGIKRLGTFVIASEMLEQEDEEDNEPVNSAPVVEEPASSEPSDNSGERNPSTGAC